MVSQKKKAKKEAYVPVKISFTSPLTPSWSPLPQEDMHFILKTLTDKLTSMGLEKKEMKVYRPWRTKKDKKAATAGASASSEPVPQVQDTPQNGWTDVVARRQLAIGINEVTKALERNELKLVLVCKSVKPKHMTHHLIALSATRGVPACQVPRLSQSVSEPLGLKSVLALGFRQCSSQDEEVFSDTVEAIKPRVPSLHVAWLPSAATTGEEEEEEEENEQKRGQKRKLESESEEIGESPSCTLQPLQVKRVVGNPGKKRKKKMQPNK